MIPNRKSKGILITHVILAIAIVATLSVVIIANIFISREKYLSDKIYPNVFIDDINVGEKTKPEVVKLFQDRNKKLAKIKFSVLYNKEIVATFSATKINLRSDINDVVERAYLIGRTTRVPSRVYQKMATILKIKPFNFETNTVYNRDPIKEFIDSAEDQYNKPAKNALFTFENGKVSSFRPDEKGLKINSDKLLNDFDVAVTKEKTDPSDKVIVLESSIIKPEVTLSESNQFGIEELIGEGKSDYTHSAPERVHNVILAASKFNGVLIPKGEVISFDKIVGDISALTGYTQAYIIKDGKTVLGDGGGVCQVSTTLFRAALHTGLPILERHAHAYRVGYYENDSKPGFDATIFSPSVDLKIKNDTQAAILIETEVDKDNNLLFFRFYGKKDNRRVELSDPILYDQAPPPPPSYQDDPTLKKGITRQVDFPAWGGKASFTYKVYKGNELAINETYLSVYRPWQAVYLVGTAD